MLLRRILRLAPLALLAACSARVPVLEGPSAGSAFHGAVHGGQQPVSGATVQLYAAGNTANGSAATALLFPAPLTDAGGGFSVTGSYACPSPSAPVYLAATGGNPGLAPGTSNSAISMVALLGPCGDLTPSTQVNIDEVTTVAAATALVPYGSSLSSMGASVADASSFASAVTLAGQLANTATGTAPGTGVPAGATVPVTLENTLADLLGACVNSPGGVAGDGSVCGNLFSLTTASGTAAATDVFSAALHLAANPTSNTTALFNLVPPASPFQPVLGAAPADFTLALGSPTALTPSSPGLHFGAVMLGASTAAQTLTLSNNSAAAISFSEFSLHGLAAAEFGQSNTCGIALAAGATCSVRISFTPAQTGFRNAVLLIGNGSSVSPLLLNLSGQGTTQSTAPQITSITPAALVTSNIAVNVTVNGSGFAPGAFVYSNNSSQPTTYISPQMLQVALPAYQVAYTGSLTLLVRSSGLVSNSVSLAVNNAVPVLNSISPTSVIAGSPSFTITITGANLSSATTVMVGSVAHTISSYDGITASFSVAASEVSAVGNLPVTLSDPAPGGGTSAALTLSVLATDNRVRTLSLPTADLVADPARGVIYASVLSGASSNANSIVAIDPLVGTVTRSVTLTSQPGRLSLASDGTFLYALLPATQQVTRIALPGMIVDQTWNLGYTPEDLAAAPGLPHTYAIAGNSSTYPQVGSLTVYDDGVARQMTAVGSYSSSSYDTVAWGNDASTLFSTSAKYSGGPDYVFTVNSNGLTARSRLSGVLGDFVNHEFYDSATGRLYDGYGHAVDALTGVAAGQFAIQNTLSYEINPFTIDSANNRAFFLNVNAFDTPIDIQAFDVAQFHYRNSLDITGLSGSTLIRWGTSGLAVGGGTQIFLIDGSFVSSSGPTSPVGGYGTVTPTLSTLSPQTAPAGSPALSLVVTGSNFTPAARVTFNSQSVPSTWQSSTQITAMVPASLLTSSVTASVLVSNGTGSENSGPLPFAVLPNLGPNLQATALGVSGEDMVWDATHSLLYVAVTNPVISNGNSIVTVDPAQSAVTSSLPTGQQPNVLALSDNGQYLYAGFQTAPVVQRLLAPTLALDTSIPLRTSSGAASYAGEIEVAPGQPQTFAVTLDSSNYLPRSYSGIYLYDGATARSNPVASTYGNQYKLTWGSDATRLFGQVTLGSSQSSIGVSVGQNGVASTLYSLDGLTDLGLRPHFDATTNRVYSDSGRITNLVDGTSAGFLELGTMTVPDAALNRAFVLRSTSGAYVLDVFNLSRQTLISTLTLPALAGYPTRMVRWGTQGIAILTDSSSTGLGMLYLLQGSDLSGIAAPPVGTLLLSPATVTAGATAPTIVTITGSGFSAVSTVEVNGSPRASTLLSSTQIQFQLSVADQATASYLGVVVTHTGASGAASPVASLLVANPTPAIGSLSPAAISAGTNGATLTLAGNGFLPSTVVRLNGNTYAATYVSPTQMHVTLLYSDLSTAGRITVTATNAGPGGGVSNAGSFEVDNPTPVLLSVSPNVLNTGSPAQTVTLRGTGFVAGTAVQVNGAPRVVTFGNSTQVQVALTTADLANPGLISLVALNAAPGGGSSAAVSIAVNNGVPGPITLSPATVVKGTSTPTLVTVTGSNFMAASAVLLNGVARPTAYLSTTQVTFTLSVADQAAAVVNSVAVRNPSPGGISPAVSLVVAAATPTPVITAISPSTVVAGSGANYLYLTGTGFGVNSIITWNGVSLADAYIYSNTSASAPIPANLVGAPGTATILLSSPTSSPSLSNPVTLTITAPPTPTLSSVSPASGPTATAFTATLTGTGFTNASVVSLGSAALTTTFISSTSLSAAVPASAVLPGNLLFTVMTPAPGGGISAPVVFTSYVSITNNSMVYSPSTGLFYLSVPGSVSAPYGNSIVPLDPVTGALGTPIFVGSEPNRMTITPDGNSLWVALDGAKAVRKVDLQARTAGFQFSLAIPVSSVQQSPLFPVVSMVAVPGQPDSVIVASGPSNGLGALAYFSSGAVVGTVFNTGGLYGLQINPATSEIYTASAYLYRTFIYGSNGLTSKLYLNGSNYLASYPDDRLQLANGRTYSDDGPILNSETGAVLGNLSGAYNGSNSVALDTASGLAFTLGSTQNYATYPNAILLHNLSDNSLTGTTIPLSIANTFTGPSAPVSGLIRWGINGLAFRSTAGIYFVQSNLVHDLSTTVADLGVGVSASGSNTTNTSTAYTITVRNAGPSSATGIALQAQLPANGVLASVTPSTGSCTTGSMIECDLGSLLSGQSATVLLQVNQLTAGSATLSVQVAGTETDPNQADNQASTTATITGTGYSTAPVLLSLTPSSVPAGSTDTVVQLAGSGFTSASTVLLDGEFLPTSFVGSSQLNATVPAGRIASLGWHRLSVSTAAPGGGSSAALPLSVYTAIPAGASHIVFEPFTQNLYATLPGATAQGNSIQILTPATATLGAPVPVGSEPSRMALSDDGNMLFVLTNGDNSLKRLNLLTQQVDSTFSLPSPTYTNYTATNVMFAVQPGSETTLAISNAPSGAEVVDFDPNSHTAVARSNTAPTAVSSPQFVNSSTLVTDSFARYTVSATGLSSASLPIFSGAGPFKLSGGFVFTSNGVVGDVHVNPSQIVGSFPFSGTNVEPAVAPDPAIQRAFFLAGLNGANYTSTALSGLVAFDTTTFLPAGFIPLNIAGIDGTTSSTAVDIVRWGQDGLAALTTSGTVYLMRGGAVLPQLLQPGTAPALATASALQHGSGNTLLMLTGSNFLPGVAVIWNGSYRTTTLVNSTTVAVNLPAGDLVSSGNVSVVASNPGSTSSAPLTVSVR